MHNTDGMQARGIQPVARGAFNNRGGRTPNQPSGAATSYQSAGSRTPYAYNNGSQTAFPSGSTNAYNHGSQTPNPYARQNQQSFPPPTPQSARAAVVPATSSASDYTWKDDLRPASSAVVAQPDVKPADVWW